MVRHCARQLRHMMVEAFMAAVSRSWEARLMTSLATELGEEGSSANSSW